jgi:hypothetical protein
VKYFIIFLILFALGALYAYWRLRPYIRLARQVFGAARGATRIGDLHGGPSEIPRRDSAAPVSEPLVRCASCGTWVPTSRSVSLGRKGPRFCSHACLERAADDSRRAHKSAS